MPSTIMAIAGHPGDALFTMGATGAQHIHNGGSGVFVSLSYGEKGAPKNLPVKQYGEMQQAASDKAAKMLGMSLDQMRYRVKTLIDMQKDQINRYDHIKRKYFA